MTATIAIIAPGEMGSAIGRRLGERGARVLTSVAGRSPASAARAKRCGLTVIDDNVELVAAADFILSIVPPGQAIAFARRMAAALGAVSRKAIFVDCNAISPQTVATVAGLIEAAGCPVVDAGIIGGPPRDGYDGPHLYASGPQAPAFAALRDHGLDIRIVGDAIGTASALKLSYASLTKGLTALGASMMLGAAHAGVSGPLRRELEESQPALAAWLDRQVPKMYPKAYRWVAEMREIAAYLEADPAGRAMFEGAARLYERIAEAAKADGPEIDTMTRFTAGLGTTDKKAAG
jgi:putative dehydrogenase